MQGHICIASCLDFCLGRTSACRDLPDRSLLGNVHFSHWDDKRGGDLHRAGYDCQLSWLYLQVMGYNRPLFVSRMHAHYYLTGQKEVPSEEAASAAAADPAGSPHREQGNAGKVPEQHMP